MNKNIFSMKQIKKFGNYQYNENDILGKGTTGTVFKGIKISTGQFVAIKAINLETIKDQVTKALLENQKQAMREINHKNVIRLIEIVEANNYCYIITQICQGKTLKDHIQSQNKLSQTQALTIFRKILEGCLAITQNCIIHRDLKPANIMLSKSLEPLIIDFGFCQIIRAKKVMKTFNVGSPSYMSPEAYLRTLYSEKSDSWSLGMILFQMLTGKTMDNGENIKVFFDKLRQDSQLVNNKIEGNIGATCRQIIQKTLKYLPEERLSISGMKYLVDVYCLKKKQVPTRQVNLSSKAMHPLIHRETKQAQTQKNLDKPFTNDLQLHNPLQNNNQGFISFVDFCKEPLMNSASSSFSKNRNQISQVSIGNDSNKNSTVFSNTKAQFHSVKNQNHYFTKKINSIPSHTNGCHSFSTHDIQRLPRGQPVFRQITVKYL